MDNKNLHIEHIEESILDGKKEAVLALTFLDTFRTSVINDIKSSIFGLNIQTKVDGSPNIVFGINPENEKWFVGTKSVFNKDPIIYYSHEEIAKGEGYRPELSNVLHFAFRLLKPSKTNLKKVGVYSGDFMFSYETVGTRDNYYIFQPNTIVYGLPFSDNSNIFFNSYDFGICIHTKYIGTKLKNMVASFNILPEDIKFIQNPKVWASIPQLNLRVSCVPESIWEEFPKEYQACQDQIFNNSDYTLYYIGKTPQLKAYIKQFINHLVKNHPQLYQDGDNWITEFKPFVQEKIDERLINLKLSSSRQNVMNEFADWFTFITLDQYKELFKTIHSISKLKLYFLPGLDKVGPFFPFLEKNNELIPTKAEGIIIQDENRNRTYKLVDRLEFSKHNFERHA